MMHLNIQALCFCYLTFFIHSATFDSLNGTDHPDVSIADGGVPAKAGEFPYLTRLYASSPYVEDGLCGGTLIGPYHVLTAAHCFAKNESAVFLNTLSINGGGPGSVNRTVKKYIKHENYSFVARTNDIAIIVLNLPVTTIPFAKLPNQTGNKYVNQPAVVAGWGITDPNSPSEPSPILLKIGVLIQNETTCSRNYPSSRRPYVDSIELCAGSNIGDACAGDSGGPILVNGVQVGITSWGYICGSTKPGIYTRITAFLSWIASTRAKNPK